METRSPSAAKVLTMVLFTLSVAGLLLFLWLSFGGTLPFNPQGYRIKVAFPYAQELADQADVRIAGVNVGKVVSTSLDPQGNREIATLDIDSQYVPIRRDAQAILRTKTILGETYVQITPGSPSAQPIPDGGMLGRAQVLPAVQLSQIFDAFDQPTRLAFQSWQAEIAKAVQGNQQNLSDVLGNLPTFTADATDILQVLNIEHNAVVNLVRNGGTVFDALSTSRSALQGLITNGETTLHTTASNYDSLSHTIYVFPTFLDQSRLTLAALKSFALNTDPLMKALVPPARNLAPTLAAVDRLSPDLRHLFANLNPLITVSQTGLPATRDVLNGARPVLAALGPFLQQLNPILIWLSLHQQLTSDFISNGATSLAAKSTVYGGAGLTCQGTPCGHYLRQFAPAGPETATFHQTRDANNRGNTYPPPTWLSNSLAFSAGGAYPGSFTFPAWDCPPGVGPQPASSASPPSDPGSGTEACWIAPPLGPTLNPFLPTGSEYKYGQYGPFTTKFPHVGPSAYSSR